MDQMVWLGNTWRSSLFFPAHSIQEARLERYVGNKLMLVDDIQITHDLAYIYITIIKYIIIYYYGTWLTRESSIVGPCPGCSSKACQRKWQSVGPLLGRPSDSLW